MFIVMSTTLVLCGMSLRRVNERYGSTNRPHRKPSEAGQ